MNQRKFLDINVQNGNQSYLSKESFSLPEPVPLGFSINPILNYNRMKSWILEQERFTLKREPIPDGYVPQNVQAILDSRSSNSFCAHKQWEPISEDSSNFSKKNSKDLISNRIVEKRRRDRMNNCLIDLSRLIPSTYVKKGRGRLEKAEIVEMAIKYIQSLKDNKMDNHSNNKLMQKERKNHYKLGYKKCISEACQFLVEFDENCVKELSQKLIEHLNTHLDKINTNDSSDNYCFSNDMNFFQNLNENKVEIKTESKNECLEDGQSLSQDGNDNKTKCQPISSNFEKINQYKFKKDIKERFQANLDLEKNSVTLFSSTTKDQSNQELESKQNGSESNNSGQTFESSGASSSSHSYSSTNFNSGHSNIRPGFALHPSRSFYVPILINTLLTNSFETIPSSTQFLHSVNISVNFYQHNITVSENNISFFPPSESVINGDNKKTN